MKTAIQELKDNSLFTEGEEYIQIVLKKTEWIELLEKEKEQIIKAHINGFDHIVVDFKKQEYAEQYYNQTYNQNQHIIDIMKADEDDGLYKMFDTDSDKKH
jgi:hypothetical protein